MQREGREESKYKRPRAARLLDITVFGRKRKLALLIEKAKSSDGDAAAAPAAERAAAQALDPSSAAAVNRCTQSGGAERGS